MTLSLFDAQLFEKVVNEKYKDKDTFNKTDILNILNEMTKSEKYYPRGKVATNTKYKVFKYFVRYCFYRNLANFDSMVLLTGDKGSGKSSFAIMLSREWCSILGIPFSPKHHMAYSNEQVTERLENLDRFSPLICVSSGTKIIVKTPERNFLHHEKISKLEGRNDFEILSYDKDNKIFECIKPEKCIKTSEAAEVFEICLANGLKIRATQNHKFLLTTGEYKELKYLTEQDEIVLHSVICKMCGREFIPHRVDALVCSPKCNKEYLNTFPNFINKRSEYQKQYRLNNKDRLLNWGKEYRAKNIDKIKQSKKLERIKNRDKYSKKYKEYYKKNKEQMYKDHVEWVKNNRDKVRACTNRRHARLMATSPEYRLMKNLRRRLNLAIKDQGQMRKQTYSEYWGCTSAELREYLKSKFTEGMTMENYGKWHVDHIIPCSKFNLDSLEEQKKCFHHTNLQPLWAIDNIKKGAKC